MAPFMPLYSDLSGHLKCCRFLWLLLLIVDIISAQQGGGGSSIDMDLDALTALNKGGHKCQAITASITCRNIGYNYTRMPNIAENDNQEEAEQQLLTYGPLLKIKCSSQLKFFLCSVYFPMCTNLIPVSIGPCRPLCQSVRRRCEPTLKKFGFSWPDALNCSRFPLANNARTMCMKGPGEHSNWKDISPVIPDTIEGNPYRLQPRQPVLSQPHTLYCKNLSKIYRGVKFTLINSTDRCAPKCGKKILFSASQRNIATVCMGSFTGISLLLTASALVALLVSSIRLSYPEKAVQYLTLCSGLSCVAYLIRLFSGHTAIVCATSSEGPVFVIQGVQNIRCTVIFGFQYFFSFAAAMWWLVLCVSWCMIAGLGWSTTTVEKRSTVYHILAWSIPLLLVIVVLVRQTVEADDLTGLCNVGNVNTAELFRFVILPNLICTILGITFLGIGFAVCSCFSPRRMDKRGTSGISTTPGRPGAGLVHSDGLIWTLGILALFYVVPSACLLIAYFHEYNNRSGWLPTEPLKELRANKYLYNSLVNRQRASNGALRHSVNEPNFETFILKICVSLIYGMCTSVWIIVRVSRHSCIIRQGYHQKSRSSSSGGISSSYHQQVTVPLNQPQQAKTTFQYAQQQNLTPCTSGQTTPYRQNTFHGHTII